MARPNHNHFCDGCFLQEQREGRVCPAAHDVYGLPDLAEAASRAAALHTAVAQDAEAVPGFGELVSRDAASRTGILPMSIRLGLLAIPAAEPLSPDSRKEAVRVLASPRTS